MLNPECLDPKDVLAHLNSLGYHDISPQQLKDFIHDLRKLIKYEQKQASPDLVELKTTDTHSPEYEDFSSDFSSGVGKSAEGSYVSYDSSTYSASTSATTYSVEDPTGNRRSYRNPTESEYVQRYHNSFIRSWNLQGCRDLSARGRKNFDPVRLYHQYQEIWKRQRIPGENKHLDLRWDIRNKMVGQQPTPKVCI